MRHNAPSRARVLAPLVLAALFALAWWSIGIDLERLWQGLPKLGRWIAMAWPPNFSELAIFVQRMAETIAVAFVGTMLACLAAVPVAWLASRGVSPVPALRWPLRLVLNAFRGVDAFVFALILVAAVGLGPFAGMLGVALHTFGSAAKLFSEQIESQSSGVWDSLLSTGAGKLVAFRYGVLPELAPAWASTALYLFEFNVRASTVLGIVGAGGIGQELKSSVDLLDFARLAAVLAVVLVAVSLIDAISAWCRARLQ